MVPIRLTMAIFLVIGLVIYCMYIYRFTFVEISIPMFFIPFSVILMEFRIDDNVALEWDFKGPSPRIGDGPGTFQRRSMV